VTPVAAFDFDKTLSNRDNVLPFLRAVRGGVWTATALALAAPRLMTGGRNAVKEALVHRLLRGRTVSSVRAVGRDFAADVVANHLHPAIVERAEWHHAQGHALVIVSASLDAYLDRVGELLGFDAVLCTRLEVGTDGVLTGSLLGANVRRAEKAARLDAWLPEDHGAIWAYGDSDGDRELLARADHPMRVRNGRLVAQNA
jgi:phosphatidylglycerophosphatase C